MKVTKLLFLLFASIILAGCGNLGIHIEVYPPEASAAPKVETPVQETSIPSSTPTDSLPIEELTQIAVPLGGASGILFTSNGGGDYKDLYLLDFLSGETSRLTAGDSNTFPGPFSPDGKKIAFTGFGLTSSYVGVMNADGSDPVDLTNLPDVDDGFPAWSPDGTKIAFTSRRTGNNEIFVMDPWGYNIVQLTANPTDDFAPSWSPDGKQIVFLSDRDNTTGVYSIYIMNADGGRVRRLTNDGGNDYTPRWSPDGSNIVFRSVMNGQSDIYRVVIDGSNLTNLTNHPGEDWSPAWSPDGSLIAFQTDRDGNWEIYYMNTDGSGQTNLTNDLADDEMPYWKPDSVVRAGGNTANKLAFVASQGDDMALFTIEAAGTNLNQLTQETMLIMNPVWSPDGQKIAFEGCAGGSLSTDCPAGVSFEIYVVNQDGTNLVNISKDPSMDRFPTWLSSSEIAFSSNRTGKDEIYSTGLDGTALVQITDSPTLNTNPRGSSDGKWLAYHCALDGETQICIQPVEGGDQVIKVAGTGPVWIPLSTENTQRLVFTCWFAGHSDLCTVKPDGTDLINLTKTDAVDEISPAWSPDGRWIAYQSNQDGVIAIYTICVDCAANPAGGRLISGTINYNNPAWSPNGLLIACVSNGSIYITGVDNNYQKIIARDVFSSPIWQPYKTNAIPSISHGFFGVNGSIDPHEMDIEYLGSVSPDGKWNVDRTIAFPKSESTLGKHFIQLIIQSIDGLTRWTVIEKWEETSLGYTIPEPIGWSQDNKNFYFTNRPVVEGCNAISPNSGDLKRVDIKTGDVTEVLPNTTSWMSLSRDHSKLAYIRENCLHIRNLNSGEEKIISIDPGAAFEAGYIVWAPNNEMIALTLAIHPCTGNYPGTGIYSKTTSIITIDTSTMAVRTFVEENNRRLLTMAWAEVDIIELEDFQKSPWLLNVRTGKTYQP